MEHNEGGPEREVHGSAGLPKKYRHISKKPPYPYIYKNWKIKEQSPE